MKIKNRFKICYKKEKNELFDEIIKEQTIDYEKTKDDLKKNKREEPLFLHWFALINALIFLKKGIFAVKNRKIKDLMIMALKKSETSISKIRENQIKIRRNNITYNNTINANYIIIMIIKTIMINIICKIRCSTFYFFYFQKSSKITLKIKGIGDNIILGNDKEYYCKAYNYPNEILINGNKAHNITNRYYFNQTDNFIELLWDNNITGCSCMFSGCSNITEINLSNFNSSQVTTMYKMFYGCSSLTSLDLSNLDTSQVTTMGGMFLDCSNLTSLNLSSFDIQQVNSLHNMFSGCSSLTSLDLSSFKILQSPLIEKMFYNCVNLEYINLINFDERYARNEENTYNNMFYNVPNNVVICINESITKNKIFPQIKNKSCYVIDCSNDWKSKQKKIINNTNECIESCNYSSPYKFEYNRKCYKNCKNVFLFDDNKNITSKCKGELGKCSLSPNASLKNELCTKCNTNYYPKENDPLNLGEYIICYKDLKGYYLDNDIYKQCYYKCKTCNMAGNNITHNCIDCNDNFPFKIEYYNYNNCYVNCNYYYYFDRENKYQCTQNSSCPAEFPVLLKETKKCIKHLFEEFKKYEQINIDEFFLERK